MGDFVKNIHFNEFILFLSIRFCLRQGKKTAGQLNCPAVFILLQGLSSPNQADDG